MLGTTSILYVCLNASASHDNHENHGTGVVPASAIDGIGRLIKIWASTKLVIDCLFAIG